MPTWGRYQRLLFVVATCMVLTMPCARAPKRSVDSVSDALRAAGEQQMMMTVQPTPPSAPCNSLQPCKQLSCSAPDFPMECSWYCLFNACMDAIVQPASANDAQFVSGFLICIAGSLESQSYLVSLESRNGTCVVLPPAAAATSTDCTHARHHALHEPFAADSMLDALPDTAMDVV